MKTKQMMYVLFISAVSLNWSACKKNDSDVATEVTEADAVELSTNAIASGSGGFALQVNSSANVSKNVLLNCGVKKDSTIVKSSLPGTSPVYQYSLNWSYLLSCSGLVPTQLTANFTGSSSYDGLRMSSNDKSTGSFILTNSGPTSTTYALTTMYNRVGTQISKIGRNNTFGSTIEIKSANLLVDKTSLQITSGTATLILSGQSSSGKSFSYTGTITFLGGGKATVLLNSGKSYAIQW